jgi:hypothetical protein
MIESFTSFAVPIHSAPVRYQDIGDIFGDSDYRITEQEHATVAKALDVLTKAFGAERAQVGSREAAPVVWPERVRVVTAQRRLVAEALGTAISAAASSPTAPGSTTSRAGSAATISCSTTSRAALRFLDSIRITDAWLSTMH